MGGRAKTTAANKCAAHNNPWINRQKNLLFLGYHSDGVEGGLVERLFGSAQGYETGGSFLADLMILPGAADLFDRHVERSRVFFGTELCQSVRRNCAGK